MLEKKIITQHFAKLITELKNKQRI